jgi:hypothetical protein
VNGTLQRSLPFAAAAVCAAGFALSAYTLARTPDELRQIARRRADLWHIEKIREAHAEESAAAQAYEPWRSGASGDLRDALGSTVGEGRFEIREGERRDLPGGWIVHGAAVSVGDTALEALGNLLAETSRQRPPWRLREGRITAGEQPGTGRVSLVFERIEPAAMSSGSE